jgi:hypothetical protein
VAQDEGPEFKPQYHKKNPKKPKKNLERRDWWAVAGVDWVSYTQKERRLGAKKETFSMTSVLSFKRWITRCLPQFHFWHPWTCEWFMIMWCVGNVRSNQP